MTYQVQVIAKRFLSSDTFVLTLSCPEIAREAKPGQFIQVKTSQLLRRPFAVMNRDEEQGWIEIGIHEVGKGTKELSQVKPGDYLSIMGPFGTPFPQTDSDTLIVGGGSGIFPLYFLAKQAKQLGNHVTVILGFQQKSRSFLVDEFKEMSHELILCSEEGDLDVTGRVTDGLDQFFNHHSQSQPTIYACGPIGMLENVVHKAQMQKLKSYVSLEVRMGCGFGVCRGCPVDLREETEIVRVRCCVEGPVFDGEQVVFETLRGEELKEVGHV